MNRETQRLDLALLSLGLVSTRTKAQDLIAAGKVSVDGRVVLKAGEKVLLSSEIELSEREHPYVSRGGVKLAAALDAFHIDVSEKIALDIGLSTGGFSHCLLLRGIKKVYGVDVGSAQLSEALKNDPRLVYFEQQDIRALELSKIEPVDLFVMDLSFISVLLVFPILAPFLKARATGIVLVKPQFEVGPDKIGSGGIVRDAATQELALQRVKQGVASSGFRVENSILSPIEGGDGNKEYLLHVQWPAGDF